MTAWKVLYSEQAKENLNQIYSYIAYSLFSPETARKQTERIMDAILSLDEMPLRHPLYEKEPWLGRGLRKLIVDRYIVFYLPVEAKKDVVILSIMYGGRKIEDLLL